MLITYPYTWEKVHNDDPLDKKTGEFTAVALSWVKQLKGLTRNEIKKGIENLSSRDEKKFPPNALEFRELCLDELLDEILCRLQAGDKYEFKNQLAFNIWVTASGDLKRSNIYQVPKIISQYARIIDKDSMLELPNYEALQIEDSAKSEKMVKKPNDRERRIFQSHMFSAINNIKPELFTKKKETFSTQEFNRDPQSDLPSAMKKLFSFDGTNRLIEKFKNKGYVMPDTPIKPDFKSFNKLDWTSKRNGYKSTAVKAVTNFLTEEGVLA